MASFYWIKLYHEILDDPKMGKLPDRAWRRCVELFLLAGDTEDGGALPELADIAWRLRVPEDELLEDLRVLEAAGILGQNDGHWRVSNFAKRQEPIADSERQRLHRERKRTQGRDEPVTDDETECNDECHEPVTERNTDKSRVDREENREENTAADAATPPDPTPETPKPKKPLTPAQEMFAAVAELCQIDLTLVTKQDRGKLNQVAKRLRETGKTPAHLAQFARYWYAADWRGQKGQAPTPHDIPSNWGRAKEWLENGGKTNAKRDDRRPAPITATERGKREAEEQQAAIVRATLGGQAATGATI